jgi:hypothetical protein
MTTTNLEPIPELPQINTKADSDNELEELHEKMDYICEKIAEEFYKMRFKISHINGIFENNFNRTLNSNFDEHELFEEQMDELIHEYFKIKKLLKEGRNIRFYKEQKESEKKNELRYARNALAHYGIENIYN